MSHSVLRSASQRTNTNNTALHEVMGTLEVYWEQLKSAALAKRWQRNTRPDLTERPG